MQPGDITRMSTEALSELFVAALGHCVVAASDFKKKPLLLDLALPQLVRLRVYIFNCTNPVGGRSPNELKFQLMVPGHKRGNRANFDYSDGRIVCVCGYLRLVEGCDSGVFLFCDPSFHLDFAFSSNVQAPLRTASDAYSNPISTCVKKNGETIVAVTAANLLEGIKKRIGLI